MTMFIIGFIAGAIYCSKNKRVVRECRYDR